MTTRLHIQSPSNTLDRFVDDVVSAAASAQRGGAIFAWATVAGLDTLFNHPATEALLKRGSFELVVGTDAITDPAALARMRALSRKHKTLACRAFVDDTRPLFHPKLAWFENGKDLVLLVGSANLTNGGLVNNWEAYTVSVVEASERSAVESAIATWLGSESANLLGVEDPRVDAAVATNRVTQIFRSERTTPPPVAPIATPATIGVTDEVLIAEIPKNRQDSLGRPQYSQVNFDQSTVQTFFGYSPTQSANTILLMSVDINKNLGAVESTQARYKNSVNWYFEIGASRGLPYPATPGDRPIAAFRRIGNGEFVYFVAAPGQPGYPELRALLDTRQTLAQAGRNMRRAQFRTADVAAQWPGCPLL